MITSPLAKCRSETVLTGDGWVGGWLGWCMKFLYYLFSELTKPYFQKKSILLIIHENVFF